MWAKVLYWLNPLNLFRNLKRVYCYNLAFFNVARYAEQQVEYAKNNQRRELMKDAKLLDEYEKEQAVEESEVQDA